MGRRIICLLAALLLLPLCALGEGKVFREGDTEPFAEDAELLTVRVAPLLGGDCMLMTLGDHSMFVDVGSNVNLDDIQAVIADAGIDRVDYVYNTHPHYDHIGGFVPLVESGFPVGALITFFEHDYTEVSVVQGLTIRTAEAYGIPVIDMKTEDRMDFGGAELISYRMPDDTIFPSTICNDRSAMLMVHYGDCSILLTGDVELPAETVMSELYDLKTDILKIPHHGLGKIYEPFLDKTDPECVFITHGSAEAGEVRDQLYKRGIWRISYATWGMITMQTDGTKWIVKQEILPGMEKVRELFPEWT